MPADGHNLMRRPQTLLSLLLLLSLHCQGQQPADAVAAAEFPALQFMPVGTVVEGISIPRYENHRVSALLLADRLIVKDRSTVILEALTASMYGEDKNQTDIKTESVTYSFATKVGRTEGNSRVDDSRFTARGKGVIFNSSTNKGFLHGPVITTVSAKLFNEKKGEKK